MGIEKRIIKLIKSMDRIMDTWDNLSLRRAIVNIYTIMIFIQITIITVFWMFGRDISTNWLGFMGIEFGAWGTILAYYFHTRGKIDEQNNESDIIQENKEDEGGEEKC